MEYENKSNRTLGENKPNQSQSKPISSKAKIACQKIRPHPAELCLLFLLYPIIIMCKLNIPGFIANN